MKQLSCEQAKQIDMVEYLASLNYYPIKVHNHDHWYLSPLRQERTPSFKVNRQLNVWFDFSLGKGGDLINFGTLYLNCSISELLKKLFEFRTQHISFHPLMAFQAPAGSSPSLAGEKKENTDSKILLSAPRLISVTYLIDYLKNRQIPLDIANQFCQEVDFTLYGKQQTAIGFPNIAGGYEIRNEHFKGSSSPKDITFIDHKKEQLAVFEGFFSFLSFCTINRSNTSPLSNSLILNSLSFFDKSRELMEKHLRVYLLLDQDTAGKTHTLKALNWNPDKYIDRSDFYRGHKDLNDWLIQHQTHLQQSQRPPRRF